MSRRRKEPLRPIADDERREPARLSRSAAAPAARVARAVALLAVAGGSDYQRAARAAGRRSGDAVSRLVARFNRDGLAAVAPGHGGGRDPTYDAGARDRILREAARTPTAEADGTVAWSLAALRRTLRAAPDGLPKVSTFTIWRVLRDAGYTFRRTRTWCASGSAVRRRRAGVARRRRPRRGGEKRLIEDAYTTAASLGLAVWCQDEAGPFQAVPHPGASWRPEGRPARQPHEHVRGGTTLSGVDPTTAQMVRTWWPAATRSSSHPNRMVTCARSGRRSRTSPVVCGVVASGDGFDIAAL